MRRLIATLLLSLLVASCGSLPMTQTPPEPTLAQRWASALNECDLDVLVKLYHTDALFWPTTSRALATRPEDVRRYYDAACRMGRNIGFKVQVASESVRVFGETVVSAGEARFSFRGADGQMQTGAGRFTVAGRRFDGTWLIIEHHSSAMPAAPSR